MRLTVIPIVRELDLGAYDEHYQGQTIWVWVSAPAAFLRKRDELLVEMSQQFQELRRFQLQPAGGSRFQILQVLPWKRGKAPQEKGGVQEAADRFNAWMDASLLPRMHAWFAELFSQGEDPETHWTAEELDVVFRTDSHLLEWIKARASEMLVAYAEEKKRRSELPSSD